MPIGILVAGELDLFAQALAGLRETRGYTPQILAVTGTNGKTTVASLTAQLVERAGRTVALAGNIGPTLLDTLAQHLDQDTLPEVWVLELSSFQLADMAPQVLLQQGADSIRLEAAAACVLNLSQDHLDWHGDMAAYTSAKARVFGNQSLMVLNRDDPAVMAMLPTPAKGRTPRLHTSVGAGVPTQPGEFGLERSTAWFGWCARRSATPRSSCARDRRPKNCTCSA